MSVGDDDFAKVAEFVRTQDTFPIKQIGWFTRIEHDLGITGADMDEFMLAFFNTFGISPEGFAPARYFHGEGMHVPIMTPLLFLLFNGRPVPPPPTYDLSIGDLVQCVRAGKWVDPPEAPEWREPATPTEILRGFIRSE